MDQYSKVIRQYSKRTNSSITNASTSTSTSSCSNETQKNGALLFGVVGGKLSEGLNFADDLGRGILVAGFPYANLNCPELKERMNYLDEKMGAGSGLQYYHNNCWKLINQCIGRAIRHNKDYACVYLIDVRYQRPDIIIKLPHWIGQHLKYVKHFSQICEKTAEFFNEKTK